MDRIKIDDSDMSPLSAEELLEMFRDADKVGPTPPIDILTNHHFLWFTGWVKQFMESDTPEWERAEGAAKRQARELARTLEIVMPAYQDLIGLPPFTEERLQVLLRFYLDIPRVIGALSPFDYGMTRSAPWHAPAEIIAENAVPAWWSAGRRNLTCHDSSPLVKFVQLFLGKAGVHQQAGTIAALFRRGKVSKLLKQGTTATRQL